MITAIVRFALPPETPREAVEKAFRDSAPRYRAIPGLIRKYYLLGDGPEGGGAYLWESREAAEAFYDEAWRAMIADRYGSAPEITYFETPVVVDNLSGEILEGTPETAVS
jgi:hypothetical protein